MRRIEGHVVIRAAPEEVFAYVSDLSRVPEYNPHVRAVERLFEGTLRKGARFRFGMRMGGIPMQPVLTITEYTPNECIGMAIDAVIPSREVRSVTRTELGTRFCLTVFLECPWRVIGPLLDRLLEPLIRRELQHAVRLIKSNLESAAPS